MSYRKALVVAGAACVGVLLMLAVHLVQCAKDVRDRSEATWLTISVVDRYVRTNGDWPRSWDGLRRSCPNMTFGALEWPRDFALLERLVVIDFDADVGDLARQTMSEFKAIRPRGGSYAYHSDYSGLLASLRAALRTGNGETRN